MKKNLVLVLMVLSLVMLSGCFDTGREVRDDETPAPSMIPSNPATGDVSL